MTQDTTQKAKLFKCRREFLRVDAGSLGEIVFRKFRFVTVDENIAKFIETKLVPDRAMGIYIDPNEPEVLATPPGTDFELRQEQIAEFIKNQNTKIDAGNYNSGKVVAANSVDTTGKSMTAPRFTAADTASLLKAQAEAKMKAEEKKSN